MSPLRVSFAPQKEPPSSVLESSGPRVLGSSGPRVRSGWSDASVLRGAAFREAKAAQAAESDSTWAARFCAGGSRVEDGKLWNRCRGWTLPRVAR